MGKVISSAALQALAEALVNIYWYKKGLRNFLEITLPNVAIIGLLNWENNKRDIVAELIQRMSRNQEQFQTELIKLMEEVCNMTDFSHLEMLEDSKIKMSKATIAVSALRNQMKGFIDLKEEKQRQQERREKSDERLVRIQGTFEKKEQLKKGYFDLIAEPDAQRRGYKLETFLRELFELFDLDPKASFKVTGEQIDGAFTFDNIDFLLEARWQKQLINAADLASLQSKLLRRLENTLGLYLSINGFSEDGVNAHSSGRRLILLMDGLDLMAVLEDRITLDQLLLRKRRHAAQTGEVYLRIEKILM